VPALNLIWWGDMVKRVFCFVVVLITAAGIWPAELFSLSVLAGRSQDVLVEQVIIRGNRRIPESTIKIWISTREGDPYNPAQIDRDVRALIAQGHFEDVKAYSEEGTRGGRIVTFVVKEWPLILDIKYDGLKSVPQSKLLEEFRKRQVGLSKESQYDPVKVRRAAAVIKDMLANEGRPDAKVTPQVEEISATAVALTFKVEEGPRVRVSKIDFEGNKVFSDSKLRKKMKYVKESGFWTVFTSKDIYHREKLATDLDRLRVLLYADNGYLRARFGEPRVEDLGRVGSWIPIFGRKGRGLKLIIPVEEGRQYRAGEIKIEDNTEFTADQIKSVIGLKPGDIVRGYSVVNKGLENLKKLYGSRGYIQFNASFIPEWHDSPNDPNNGTVDITFALEEGKQFTLRRLEFVGNTFTRDNVLRREVLLNEGDRYNQELWELSLLRLNQLGYFEQIKPEDATINTNEREGLVDITLKVQEKGRQQISFTGGVSGIGGSFIGIDYSTNNLLGYGESLSFSLAAGNRQKIFAFGFTEPYLRGRPISLGFSVFYQNLQFFGQGFGKTLSTSELFAAFGGQALFTEKTAGFSVSASAPLQYFTPRFRMGRFIRLGLSYSYRTTSIDDPEVNKDSDPTNDFIVTFRQSGIRQSTLTPTISYNTLNSALDPTKGQSLTLGLSLSGGPLGGNVNLISPYVEYKYFRPLFAGREASARLDPKTTRTIGFRIFFGHISPFGKRFESNSISFVGGTPLFARFYLGGEESIRGYNIRSISPLVPVERTFTTRNVFAEDLFTGTRLKVRRPESATRNSIAPSVLNQFVFTNEPVPRLPGAPEDLIPIGGDTEALFNLEYRIPLIGPISFVPFFDIGSVFNLRRLSDQFIRTEFVPTILAQFPDPRVRLNPLGQTATKREIKQARTPETPPGGLPPGFRFATIRGERQDTTRIMLSAPSGGIFDNYRYSVGGEFRVQVPVINVPFRLIFAWNPNARVNNPFIFEERRAIRISIGRTF
jgi:outer membrane protein insertion porin family